MHERKPVGGARQVIVDLKIPRTVAMRGAMILWRESPALKGLWESLQSQRLTVGRMRLGAQATNLTPVPGASVQILLNTAAYEAIAAMPEAMPSRTSISNT